MGAVPHEISVRQNVQEKEKSGQRVIEKLFLDGEGALLHTRTVLLVWS